MNWTKALTLEAAAKKQIHTLKVAGKKLCLWHTQSQWFAFDLRCPHEGYPLSQGDVNSDCVLTCRWHNWQFNLKDGQPLRGEDRLQTYPVQIRDDALWVDVTPPPESQRRRGLINDMQKVFKKRYYGAMGRIWAKWHHQGFEPNQLLAEMVQWSVPHFERGFTHGLACVSEWLDLAARFEAPQKRLSCFLEATDFLAEEIYGEPAYPYPQGQKPFEAGAFLQALEIEDEATALAMMRGALASGMTFDQIEACLTTYAFSHYLGYGHVVIYLTKIPALIARLGTEVEEPILAAWIRYAIAATRDDVLPEFRQYRKTLDQVEAARQHRTLAVQKLEPPPLGASLGQVWKWLIAAVAQHTDEDIFKALIIAAARNLLHFDTKVLTSVALKPNDTFSWLSLTHALTFAEAAQALARRYPKVTASALVQLAAFIGRVKPVIDGELNVSKWQVIDPEEFKTWAQQQLLEHGETDGIYPAHWLKTYLAVDLLADQFDPESQALLRAALNRYMHAGFHKKLPERTVFQALDLLEDRDPLPV